MTINAMTVMNVNFANDFMTDSVFGLVQRLDGNAARIVPISRIH